MFKLHFRTLLTMIMFAVLIQGIFELKNFLSFNFIENETQMKRILNDALNGKLPESRQSKKYEKDNLKQ
jgi:hypothetical protein